MGRQLLLLGPLAALGLAGCDGGNLWNACTDDRDCPAGEACVGGRCRSPSDGGPDGGDGGGRPPCTTHDDCDGGVCVDGACCPSEDRVCGRDCCEGAEVCFAGACVVPGDPCHSAGDCEEGQYCEVGLGESPADGGPGDAGADGGADGGLCLHDAPLGGRCLDLPPRCPGGLPPDDGRVCIPDCEHHPEGGPLDAVERWSWGPETAIEFPAWTDVWATPTVGRMLDTNCDGRVDLHDPPVVVFVSGNARGTCCSCGGYEPSTCLTGILRVVDGLSGREVWSLRRASEGSIGFAGLSVAIGDLLPEEGGLDDPDATSMEIAAVTGEGHLVIVDALGDVLRTSDRPLAEVSVASFGWGGGLAVADMNGDGFVEIAYAATVYTTFGGGLTRLFAGPVGVAGSSAAASLSTFADVDGAPDGHLELVVGKAAYRYDGSQAYLRDDLPDGYPGLGDFDRDGRPEVVLVSGGSVWVLDGASGETLAGPAALGGTGFGGPPTVADFDGDGLPEIGVARADFYSVLKPDLDLTELETGWLGLEVLWQTANHDLSSSVTGSTVFDFEGDGAAEVVYNDECFLWVYDGSTGAVRFATPTTSFTATEASLVADVDGDGHAEILMVSNGADPSSAGWGCDVAPWNAPDPASVRPAWSPPEGATAYRGITVYGDSARSWVGTRTLWNQHSYHVSNICDFRDSACEEPNVYGSIPERERPNWAVDWLNNFRQNVQDVGLFDAPDATLTLSPGCDEPLVLTAWVRNLGAALLPAPVEVAFFVLRAGGAEEHLGSAATATALFPGQVAAVVIETTAEQGVTVDDSFVARIVVDPEAPTFHECRDDNNETPETRASCLQ